MRHYRLLCKIELMSKKHLLFRLTLWDAAKIYVVYLYALRLSQIKRQTYLQALRHILRFYGYRFPLAKFDGQRVLQYADIYDPYDYDPLYREYGACFWKFVHWMKRNDMIPAWTEPEKTRE